MEENAKIIAAEKPLEGASGLAPPEFIASRTEGIEAGGNHGLGFDGLLVEPGALAVFRVEAVAADWSEMAGGVFCWPTSQRRLSRPTSSALALAWAWPERINA